MSKNEIIERLGADNWQMVQDEFSGETEMQILDALTQMFPYEPDANAELAHAVFSNLD